MTTREAFRPTLLVGLGGTGCKIVERVFLRAQTTGVVGEGKVVVLGFDTDENDLRRLKVLDRRQQIRFSTAEPVYTILKDNPDVHDWFVADHQLPSELRTMTLLDGAGQIRMLSRLALHVAMKNPQTLLNIQSVIGRLGVHNSRDVFEGAINIMLVGSLAGATGSGIFISVALLLDQVCRERGITADVRGVFLLPDVYTQAGSLPTSQIPNVRANGYASLRELHAVVAAVTDRGAAEGFQFEYVPGHQLKRDALPMKSLTLIDFENDMGGNLGRNIEHYMSMAERAVYLQIFSPIGARVSSVTVNDVRAKLAAAAREGSELYNGVGISVIVYPMEDVRDYLILRYARENLSDDWLMLDRIYRERLRRFKEAREAGDVSAQQPDQSTGYIEDLDQLGVRERRPFYREIHRRLYPIVEDERGDEQKRPIYQTYLESLERHIRDTFWSAPEKVAKIDKRTRIDPSQLEDSDDIMETIRQLERILLVDWRALEEASLERPDDIFNNVWASSETASEAEWQPYHLQAFLIKEGSHPVQNRYFLYAVLREAQRRRESLDPKGIRDRLFGLGRVFDSENGQPDAKASIAPGTSKAIDRARQITQGTVGKVLGQIFGNKRKDFCDQYVSYYNSCQRLMRDLAEAVLYERLYSKLTEEIEMLLKILGNFFLELEHLQQTLDRDLEKALHQHDSSRSAFDGNLFVYADTTCKQALWEEFHEAVAGLRPDEVANRELARTVYDRYQAERRSRRSRRREEGSFLDQFRKAMIDDFARRMIERDFSSLYDFSVLTAIRRECSLKDWDWKRRLREVIHIVGSQSEPFLDFVDQHAGQRIMYWAVSPKILEEYGDQREFDELFTHKQGESPLILPEFSEKELLCSNYRVNLDLTDLKKLHPGDPFDDNVNAPARGIYFSEYSKIVEHLIDADLRADGLLPAEFSPHVHRNWHKPGCLPEIFPQQQRRFEQDLDQTFVLACALNFLVKDIEYDRQIAIFDLTDLPGGGPRRQLADGHDDWHILQALAERPEFVRAILRRWPDIVDRGKDISGSRNFDRNPTVRAIADSALTARLLAISATRTDEEKRDRRTVALLAAQFSLLHDLVERVCADLAPAGRHQVLIETMQDLGDKALERLRNEEHRPETLANLDAIFKQAMATATSDLSAQ